MRIYYPPYDILIIGFSTLIIGFFVKRLFKTKNKQKLLRHLLPFCIAYIFVSLTFAFVTDELPLKFYIDTKSQFDTYTNKNGPEIGRGLIAGLIYLISVIFNFILWLFSLLTIFLSIIKKKNQVETDNE